MFQGMAVLALSSLSSQGGGMTAWESPSLRTVRLDEERSNELVTPPQTGKSHLLVRPYIPHPNPFRDSLRSSQSYLARTLRPPGSFRVTPLPTSLRPLPTSLATARHPPPTKLRQRFASAEISTTPWTPSLPSLPPTISLPLLLGSSAFAAGPRLR